LRERRDDIPPLVRHLVARHAQRLHRPPPDVTPAGMEALVRYPWPGNVRELENFLERAVLLTPAGAPLRVPPAELPAGELPANGTPAVTLADAEREHILTVLRATGWRVSGPQGAAARLGMKRTTLQSRMRRLGIRKPG
jgi:formate hydrogenlyase transcriptional activator